LNVEAVLGSFGKSAEKKPCPISQAHAGFAVTPMITPLAVTRKDYGLIGSDLTAIEIGSYFLTLCGKMVILVRCERIRENELGRRKTRESENDSYSDQSDSD
jgi:hypothetical protein